MRRSRTSRPGPLVATEGVPVPFGTDVARFQDANFTAPVGDFTAAEGGSVTRGLRRRQWPRPRERASRWAAAPSTSSTSTRSRTLRRAPIPSPSACHDAGGSIAILTNDADVADAPIHVVANDIQAAEGQPLNNVLVGDALRQQPRRHGRRLRRRREHRLGRQHPFRRPRRPGPRPPRGLRHLRRPYLPGGQQPRHATSPAPLRPLRHSARRRRQPGQRHGQGPGHRRVALAWPSRAGSTSRPTRARPWPTSRWPCSPT